MEIKVDDMIFEYFEKQDKTKFASYPHLIYFNQKKEEFLNKLPNNLYSQFEQVQISKKTYQDESFKEFIRFVLTFVKEIF